MGDPRRFDEFAIMIERTFPNRDAVIADVAGGKGYLQAALRQRGYRNITSWDTAVLAIETQMMKFAELYKEHTPQQQA